MYNCALLRYGEIGLKSKSARAWFEKKYVYTIREALDRKGIKGYTIKNLGRRFVVISDKDLSVLSKVGGIQSVSPAVYFEFKDKEDLLLRVKKYGSLVKGKKFAAKVKRVGTHKFTSQELAKEIGDTLYEFSNGVDLSSPEVTVNVEVRDKEAYLFTEKVEGVGGLPVDSSQKILCLFSGGMDSPVAAYNLMKRGCAVDFLFINLQGEKSLYEAAKVYNYLTQEYWYGSSPKFIHVDARSVVEKIQKEVPSSLRQVVLKVAFYQIASLIPGYSAIATGESLSQKSSQTLHSLAVIDSFIDKLVIRPVIGMDKEEVMAVARKIGTYYSSQSVTEYCSLSKGPVTTVPKLEEIRTNVVDVSDVEWSVTKGVVEVSSPVEEKVNNAVVVDIRDELVQEEDSLNGEMYSYPAVLNELEKFSREREYIIVCTFGVKSDEVAFMLRKKGVKAVSMSTAVFKKYLKDKEKQGI